MALQSFDRGDWVRGRSRDGELVRGYVVDVNTLHDIIRVRVMESDNEIIIGKSIWIRNKYAEKLPFVRPASDSELLTLIDLALQTRDEQWFNELTEKLSGNQNTDAREKNTSFIVDGKPLENIDSKQ